MKINFAKPIGKIKPLHGINNMPTVPVDALNLFHYYAEACIPYVRLHDTGSIFGASHLVDVDSLFPDFSADENDPASYDFAFTDALLKDMQKTGVKPFYRLGSSIETFHKIKAYHIYPPQDSEKWARICEHIIAHYNEGWAEGFYYGIEYWEIWNEPDGDPIIADNSMWKGTKEQFFELYVVTAKHLKKCFPNLKIGGYGSCGFYALSEADYSSIANSSARTEYFIDFFLEFLKYISEHKTPMDFFSWHSYANYNEILKYSYYVKEKLQEFGYGQSEIILDEWNPGLEAKGKAEDGANIATMLCVLQHSPIDMAMYYEGSIMIPIYCGLFDTTHWTVFKAYYAFKAFGRLYELGTEVESSCKPEGGQIVAAIGANGEKTVMLCNETDTEKQITIPSDNLWNAHIVSESFDWEETIEVQDSLILPPYAVALLENQG